MSITKPVPIHIDKNRLSRNMLIIKGLCYFSFNIRSEKQEEKNVRSVEYCSIGENII